MFLFQVNKEETLSASKLQNPVDSRRLFSIRALKDPSPASFSGDLHIIYEGDAHLLGCLILLIHRRQAIS